MHEELIQLLAAACRIAGNGITSAQQMALRSCVDQACSIPAELGWERKAAAHAEFLNALADATDDPRLGRLFCHGAGFAYDLMITAGRAADGIVANSRRRMLACLCAGDADEAAHEMEKHLKTLHFMGRLTASKAQRASA